MISLEELATKLLDNACGAYPVDSNDPDSNDPDSNWVYRIDLCCISFEVTAKPFDGKWQVFKIEQTDDTTFEN